MSGPIRRGFTPRGPIAKGFASPGMLPTKPVAEYPGESIGERVAAKNNEIREAIVDGLLTDEAVDAIFAEIEPMIPSSEKQGGKRQRGGGWWADTVSSAKQKYDFTKAVVLTYSYLVANKTVELGRAAVPPTKQALGTVLPPVKDFLMREVVSPLLGSGTPAAKIALNLAYELFRVPITGIQLGIGGAGYTANFVAQVIKYFNEWGRTTSSYLLSDEVAVKAATAAVSTAKSATATGAVALIAANQLGLVPLSAILAAILFSVQMNFATGAGKAYAITSFYAWYNAQPDATQKAVKKAATEYASAAASAAKTAAKSQTADAAKVVIKTAAKSAAKNLGAALSETGKAGKNAFNAVADAAGKAGEKFFGSVPVDVASALEDAAPAAALAAVAAEAEQAAPAAPAAVGAPEAAASASAAPAAPALSAAASMQEGETGPAAPPSSVAAFQAAVRARAAAAKAAKEAAAPARRPSRRAASAEEEQEGGGKKTRKRSVKRRSTRRRKAPKYLAAPVFAY